MNVLQRRYRTWKLGRKFVRAGKGCRFQGRFLEVDGHVEVGERVKIRDHVILRTHGMGRILIGDRTGLSYFCMIEATRCIRIGCFTGIAEFTVIRDTNHLVFGTAEHWRLTPHIAEPIVIGDACMITSRCYIGPGVAIGDGAVVAPGSVVTKDIPPFEVWGGNPARKIGHRTQGPMAEAMRRRYAELIEAAGVQATEHRAALEAMEAVAEQGINRAAQERDRLRAEFAASPAAGGGGLDD